MQYLGDGGERRAGEPENPVVPMVTCHHWACVGLQLMHGFSCILISLCCSHFLIHIFQALREMQAAIHHGLRYILFVTHFTIPGSIVPFLHFTHQGLVHSNKMSKSTITVRCDISFKPCLGFLYTGYKHLSWGHFVCGVKMLCFRCIEYPTITFYLI